MTAGRHTPNVISKLSCRLSFYKESLGGETDNYVHLRAAAEQKDPVVVLRELAEETLTTIVQVQELTASDPELSSILHSYLMVSAACTSREEQMTDQCLAQGYLEFHFRARRYHLEDLQM